MGSGVYNQRMQSTEAGAPAAPRDGPLEWSDIGVAVEHHVGRGAGAEDAGQQALRPVTDLLKGEDPEKSTNPDRPICNEPHTDTHLDLFGPLGLFGL